MLSIPPPLFHRPSRRVRKNRPPALPNLISASFNSDEGVLTMGFDRAVDIANIEVGTIQVSDPITTHFRYRGVDGGASMIGPATVQLVLQTFGPATSAGVEMNASDENGIVAVGGGAWPGAVDVALPYSVD